MENDKNVQYNLMRLGFFQILTLIFITLKLTGYISWSWWWVLSPVLIPVGLIFSIVIIVLTIFAIAGIVSFFVNK